MEEQGLPCPFLKKKTDFGEKDLNCVHPWGESFIQNVVLRVSRRKTSKNFLCRAFFSCFFTKSLLKNPNATKHPLL